MMSAPAGLTRTVSSADSCRSVIARRRSRGLKTVADVMMAGCSAPPQVNFYVEDIEAAADFYRGLLGFTETFRTPQLGIRRLALLTSPSRRSGEGPRLQARYACPTRTG